MIVFIEPGPGIAPYFYAVAEYIGKDKTAFYSTHPKSRSKLKKLGAKVFPTSLCHVNSGCEIPNYELFTKTVLNPKNITDSPSEVVLKKDLYNHYHRLDSLFQTLNPSAIFVWNGSGLTSSISIYLAQAKKIKTIYGENGYFPLTMQIDSKGVNALSSITDKFNLDDFLQFDYSIEQHHIFDDLLKKIRGGGKFKPSLSPNKVNASVLSKLHHEINTLNFNSWLKPGFLCNRKIPEDIETLPDKYIFFPLQVRNDSQLTNHSPLFNNDTYAMIDAIATAAKENLPDFKLVVKLHPADIGKTDYDPLISKFKNIIWIKKGNIQQLLKGAEIVVTVNSTVGFEALFYYKPVILLGDNFYNIPGLTHCVREKASLAQILKESINSQPIKEKVDAALMYYYFHFFVNGHCRDYSESSISNVAEKIVSMSK